MRPEPGLSASRRRQLLRVLLPSRLQLTTKADFRNIDCLRIAIKTDSDIHEQSPAAAEEDPDGARGSSGQQ